MTPGKEPLPIDPLLPDIAASLKRTPNLVLQAPTGAGKTTRVPPALLDSRDFCKGQILVLEPRRLAARAAARRMSAERSTTLGADIGYHVRFDKRCGPHTCIVVATPGILLRKLQDDPFLEGVAAVLFDEFHERSLENDLALGLVRLLQQTVRPDLRLVVMSATIEVEPVSAYLGGCPIVVSEGRLHPVEISYEPKPADERWTLSAASAVERLLPRTESDLLVFLPGLFEIRQTAQHLEDLAVRMNLAVLPLHGDLPAEQQDAALLPQSRRKVVLATNVAETSVTVEGITGVVDTGLARQMTYDLGVGLDRLQLTPISRASADQRAGRAGRTRPGVCIRLWSEVSNRARPEQSEPEIRRVDLAGAILQLLALGEKGIEQFPWLEAPRAGQTDQAMCLLRRLGIVEEKGLTELGQRVARLPVHPRLGRLLIEGHRLGHPESAALAAALLAERDPFRALDATHSPAQSTDSDVLDRVEALEEFDRKSHKGSALRPVNRHAARFVLCARDQLLRTMRQDLGREKPADVSLGEALQRSLLAAFPDRLVKRREPKSPRGVMVGGRGVRLAPPSGVREAELFLAIDIDAGKGEALIRLASAVQRDWLPAHLLTDRIDVVFDAAVEKVIARRRLSFEDLLIEESPAALPADEATASVLAEAALSRLDRVLPAADSPAGSFLARARWLGQALPELGLPAFTADDLAAVVPQLCHGCRSFDDLRRADWLSTLQNSLTFQQRQAVDREAPERIVVPSGSRIALTYEGYRPPVLAVRIQEIFGWRDTPRLAGGKVKVLLHLLAPNYRPQQVTDDLASFWANTYPLVRKDLRARYPRHAWPEDPLAAPAERRPKRKS